MNVKRWFLLAVGVALAGLGLWIGLKPADWQTWLGFTKADYFTYGQNYAFYSGIGPMMLTAAGMSTIIGGLWHTHNCHEDGCYRVGKHKINGTPWCNVHHEAARHVKTTEQLLAEQVVLLETQNDELLAEAVRLLRRLAGEAAA